MTITYLREDVASYRRPLDEAFRDCQKAFEDASTKVRGAEPRVSAAIKELEALEKFCEKVELHLRKGSFHSLPGLRHGRAPLEGYHHLTVGPWRGVFQVSKDGAQVIAMLFSKAPHSLQDRLDEIVRTAVGKKKEAK